MHIFLTIGLGCLLPKYVTAVPLGWLVFLLLGPYQIFTHTYKEGPFGGLGKVIPYPEKLCDNMTKDEQ